MVGRFRCLLNSQNVIHLSQQQVFKGGTLVRMKLIRYVPAGNLVDKDNLSKGSIVRQRNQDCFAPLHEIFDHYKEVEVPCPGYQHWSHEISLGDFVRKP